MKTICIVHYNTPELTEAAILSVRKTGTDWPIVVFDNSTKKPFTKKMKGVKVVDNTKGQIVDFDKEIKRYPERCYDMAKLSEYGSVKHMMSVQALWDIVPDGFILLESDVLVRDNIEFLWDENYAACGKRDRLSKRTRYAEADRLLPFLCYLNVPLLKKHGAKYYDPQRCWGLMPGGRQNWNNWYDTGASVLEDIVKTKPYLVARLYPNLEKCYVHYHGGSWRSKDLDNQKAFLSLHTKLWEPYQKQDAKIYICTHCDFTKPVGNPIYEVIDARKYNNDVAKNGLKGLFYSEFLTYRRVAERKKLPKMVGFCGYRKYFDFMNDVPDLEKVECIVAKPMPLGMSMHKQYASFSNVDDIDLLTDIIEKEHKEFAQAWRKALNADYVHPYSMFVMQREAFKEMMKLVVKLLDKWVEIAGTDIEGRIDSAPHKYRITGQIPFAKEYQYRIGGELGERIVSAWIDWKFPHAMQVGVKVTEEKR